MQQKRTPPPPKPETLDEAIARGRALYESAVATPQPSPEPPLTWLWDSRNRKDQRCQIRADYTALFANKEELNRFLRLAILHLQVVQTAQDIQETILEEFKDELKRKAPSRVEAKARVRIRGRKVISFSAIAQRACQEA
jgi:hypothetical protein